MAAGKQREKAWSLAAAARAAREARIAAVRYIREAAIEREWHAAVLSYGHQARAARSGNPDRPAPCSSPRWATRLPSPMAGTRPVR
jgi:hypothetical protein